MEDSQQDDSLEEGDFLREDKQWKADVSREVEDGSQWDGFPGEWQSEEGDWVVRSQWEEHS